MKSILLTILGLAVGLFAGYFLLSGIFGAGAGIGIATGLQAGACLTVEAAREQGLITEAQVPDVLRAAAGSLVAEGGLPEGMDLADSAAKCEAIVAELRAAAEQAR